MRICPDCGTDVPNGSTFCGECGLPMTVPVSGQTIPVPPPAPDSGGSVGDLIVVSGPGGHRGTRFCLTGSRQRIGRGPAADIALRDPAVSNEHALIWYQAGFFYIQDEASRNGTLVEGSRVVRETLQDGDEIQIGDTVLVLRTLPRRHA